MSELQKNALLGSAAILHKVLALLCSAVGGGVLPVLFSSKPSRVSYDRYLEKCCVFLSVVYLPSYIISIFIMIVQVILLSHAFSVIITIQLCPTCVQLPACSSLCLSRICCVRFISLLCR